MTGAATASFSYDADGRQVIGTVNGVTTYYVGNHYEVKGGVVSKYYFAGATRLAVRTGGRLSYLLGDHLGSTSLTTDENAGNVIETRYKPWGEVRFTWTEILGGHHLGGVASRRPSPSTNALVQSAHGGVQQTDQYHQDGAGAPD